MPFDVLLLAAPSYRTHMSGASSDKVSIDKSNLQDGEFVLFFDKIDTTKILRRGLGIPDDQQCCDGIVYYAYEQHRVVCLVEMKHTKVKEAPQQIQLIKKNLYESLRQGCQVCKEMRELFGGVIWRAYVYRSSSTSINTEECKAELLKYFDKDNIEIAGNGDILSFLRKGTALGRQTTYQKWKKR